PLKRTFGYRLSALVRGSRARYIHGRGRYANGSASPSNDSSQRGDEATPGARRAPPTCRYSPSATPRSPGGRVSFQATGRSQPASKSVHHSEPTASAPGAFHAVWRIQTARG